MPRTQFRAKVGAAVPPPPDRSRTVPSILFTLRADDGARLATLDGRGFGHGIGMSQWGAYGKALRGMKAAAILAAYYGGTQPTKVPAGQAPGPVRVAIDTGKPQPANRRRRPENRSPPRPRPASPPSPGRSRRHRHPRGRPGPPGGCPPPAGAGEAVVSASGPFRILDSKGKVVVPVATGQWRITPAAKGRAAPCRPGTRPALPA